MKLYTVNYLGYTQHESGLIGFGDNSPNPLQAAASAFEKHPDAEKVLVKIVTYTDTGSDIDINVISTVGWFNKELQPIEVESRYNFRDGIKVGDIEPLAIVLVEWDDSDDSAYLVTSVEVDRADIEYRGIGLLADDDIRFYSNQIVKVLASASWMRDNLKMLQSGVALYKL